MAIFSLSSIRKAADHARMFLKYSLAHVNPAPILVLGNQKSGTSAIAALLARVTGLSVTIDLPLTNRPVIYDKIYSGDIPFQDLIHTYKLEFSRSIIKDPHLTIFYEQLKSYFPQAKFVFVLRDPRDNVRSILDRLKLSGNLKQLEPHHYQGMVRSWPLIIDGRWLGLEGCNYIEMLAARWNFMVDIFLKNRSEFVLMRYEDFLKDKTGQIADLARRLQLDPYYNISDQVEIQFQPAGNSNIKWENFFGIENLHRIEKICGDKMRILGYPVDTSSPAHRPEEGAA